MSREKVEVIWEEKLPLEGLIGENQSVRPEVSLEIWGQYRGIKI